MNILDMMKRPVFAPADEGTPGEEGAATLDPGQGGDGHPPGGEADAGGDGAASPAPRSSILDYAPKGEQQQAVPEGDAWKMPEGLELPDHLVGTDATTTLQKLATAYKGARQELSTRKKEDGVLEGSVPKDASGYTFDAVGVDPKADAVLADLTSEESQEYLAPFRETALELGIPDATFAKFMHQSLSKMHENGLSLSTDPEQAMQINGEAEMEALTTALGPQGAETALRQLDTFAVKLANNGILQSQDDVQEFAQMVGTAKAAQIMQRIIVAEFGEQAIPPADAVDGAPTLDEAYAANRAALSMPPGADREEAVQRSEQMIAKAMREGSTPGQIRSRVL